MGILRKTILMYLLVFLIPFIFIGLISFYTGKKGIQESLGRSFEKISRETIEKVDRHVYFNVFKRARTWADLEIMQEVLTGDIDGRLSAFLIELSRQENEFSGIFISDPKGVVVSASNPLWLDLRLGEEEFFRRAAAGKPVMDDIQWDYLTQNWGMRVSFPIQGSFEEGKTIGVLTAIWNSRELFSLVQNSLPDESESDAGESMMKIFLVRKDGLIISAPEKHSLEVFYRNLVKAGMESAIRVSAGGEKGYRVEEDEQGRTYLVGFSPSKGFQEYSGFGWGALVMEDTRISFQKVDRLKFYLVSIGFSITLIVIFISIVAARRATGPIMDLTRASQRVSNGDLDVQVACDNSDELGVLAQNFNRMIRDLKEKQTQLRKANEFSTSVIRHIMNSLIVVDSEGMILTTNKAAQEFLGYSEDELVGQRISLVFWGEFPGDFRSIRDLIRKGDIRDVKTYFRSKDGIKLPVLFGGSPVKNEGKIEGYICVAQDISDKLTHNAMLEYKATHDSLTDLPNRNLLQDRLQQAILSGKRVKQPVSLLILGLDQFRQINETLGHSKGDFLLKKIGPKLQAVLRESDTIARLGGDEFAVMMPNISIQGAIQVARKIIKNMENPVEVDGMRLDMEVSIGISVWPNHSRDPSELLQHADIAMHIAKQTGRGYSVFNPSEDEKRADRLRIFSALRQAIDRDELILHYQPKIDLQKGSLAGVEALLRWNHSPEGMVLPQHFIPLAEQTGLVRPLSLWVLNAAIQQAKAWNKGGKGIRVAVNFSARNLQDSRLPEQVKQLLVHWDLPGNRLECELTESAIMADPGRAYDVLTRLHELGIHLSVDDFGTGYTSLSYLKKLPIDSVKIDKSFVKSMIRNSDDKVIVRTIIDLAHDLSLSAVAEGVEDKETLDELIRMKCDFAQGYYMGRPVTVEVLRQWYTESVWGARSTGEVLDLETL